ncbi:Protein BIC1 [Linum grandiflorum]
MKPVEDPLSPSPYIPEEDDHEEQIKGSHATKLWTLDKEEEEEEEEEAAAASSVEQQDASSFQEEAVVEESTEPATTLPLQQEKEEDDSCVREKLKRHRTEVAGRVWIPEIWGQEDLLKDWTDCSAFDAALASNGILSARDALVRQGLKDTIGLSVGNSC